MQYITASGIERIDRSYSNPNTLRPIRTTFLCHGIFADQLVWAERWPFGWLILLEENCGDLARLQLDECDLMDLMLRETICRGHIKLRMLKAGLQVRVSGEVFALLPRSAL